LRGLARTEPGFDPDGVTQFTVSLSGDLASDPPRRNPLQTRLVEAVVAIPGVSAAAVAHAPPPMTCCWGAARHPDGVAEGATQTARANLVAVSADYFSVMRIPLRRGRWLQPTDDIEKPTVPIVISESARRRFWGDRDPIGAFGKLEGASSSRF